MVDMLNDDILDTEIVETDEIEVDEILDSGKDGKDGETYTPVIDEVDEKTTLLSWQKGDKPPAEPVNIKGRSEKNMDVIWVEGTAYINVL